MRSVKENYEESHSPLSVTAAKHQTVVDIKSNRAQTEQERSSGNWETYVCVCRNDRQKTDSQGFRNLCFFKLNNQLTVMEGPNRLLTSNVSKCQPASLQFAAHSHTYISPAAHTKALSVQRRPGGRKEVNDSALCAHQFNSTRSRGRKSFGRSPAVPADG